MTNIKINFSTIEQFIEKNNLSGRVSKNEVKNIFDEANVYLEDGSEGKDEYLTGEEVPTFQRLIKKYCSTFSNYYGRYLNSIQTKENGDITLVECNKSEAEVIQYKKNLKNAKEIIEKNYKSLELTEEECNYIKNSSIVIENYGSARYDKESDSILFNINDCISVPSTGSLVKVLIHEATHASIKSAKDTKKEERECESRALKLSYQLYKEGKIDNFEIMQNCNIDIKSLDSPEKIDSFVDMWIKMGYKDYSDE